jgi:hypothetical protein
LSKLPGENRKYSFILTGFKEDNPEQTRKPPDLDRFEEEEAKVVKKPSLLLQD